MATLENNKERFISLLKGTARQGVDNVIAMLEKEGFFTAPASTKFHLNTEGGLLEHSLNVYDAAMMLKADMVKVNPSIEKDLPDDSIVLSTLLHDVCKSDIYFKTMLSRKKPDGYWEKYEGYQTDYTKAFPMGHGEKSVIMVLSWGLSLTKEEMLSIRWHMAPWDMPTQSGEHKESFNAAKALTPLCPLVQIADQIATALIER